MPSTYPTTLDTFSNPIGTDKVNNAVAGLVHSTQHAQANDAIEALEAKVGATNSAVTSSHDYKLSEVTGSDKAVSKAGSQALTNKTIDGNSNTLTVLAPTQLSGLVPMANGGLNVALSDPNADRILFWDDSAGQYAYLTAGSGLTIAGTTISASGTVLNTTMTADEDLTIGQTVGVSNFVTGDKVARAGRFNQSITMGITDDITLRYPNLMCPIGGDKFAFLSMQNSDDGLYVTVGDVDTDTLTTTLGTEVAVTNDIFSDGNAFCICKLDTDKFIVLYREDASTTIIKYRIGTVSGTTITLGAAATFTTGASQVDSIASTYLSADKAVMFYGCATPTDSAVITFTTTGTATNVVGTPASVGTTLDNNISKISIKKTDTDTFILASASGYAQVGTCIGTTNSTIGSEVQFSATASAVSFGIYISVLTSSLVVISYETSSSIPEYIAGTISGTTPTFGTPFTGGQYLLPIYGDSTTSFLVQQMTGSGQVRRYTISGTTITLDKIVILGMNNDLDFIAMDNSYYVLVGAGGGTTFSINVQGMSNSFLGIAQATVAKGATVSVLYSGEDTNQTGLVAGGIYEPSGTGGLTLLSSSSTTFTAGKQPLMKAINSTTIII